MTYLAQIIKGGQTQQPPQNGKLGEQCCTLVGGFSHSSGDKVKFDSEV